MSRSLELPPPPVGAECFFAPDVQGLMEPRRREEPAWLPILAVSVCDLIASDGGRHVQEDFFFAYHYDAEFTAELLRLATLYHAQPRESWGLIRRCEGLISERVGMEELVIFGEETTETGRLYDWKEIAACVGTTAVALRKEFSLERRRRLKILRRWKRNTDAHFSDCVTMKGDFR